MLIELPDRLDMVLAALWDANKLVGINWDNVAATLTTKYPDKTPRAFGMFFSHYDQSKCRERQLTIAKTRHVFWTPS
jgi:hypothetical protein